MVYLSLRFLKTAIAAGCMGNRENRSRGMNLPPDQISIAASELPGYAPFSNGMAGQTR